MCVRGCVCVRVCVYVGGFDVCILVEKGYIQAKSHMK